jgi:hypothetical protein
VPASLPSAPAASSFSVTHAIPAAGQVLTVRGKLRHGFELDVTITWVAVLPAKAACDEPREVKGTVQVADASRDAVQARGRSSSRARLAQPCLRHVTPFVVPVSHL